MTISYTDARDQFQEICWALVKGEPIPAEYGGEPAANPLEVCMALVNSNDIVPADAGYDELIELLERNQFFPEDRTYGSIAGAVLCLMDVNDEDVVH